MNEADKAESNSALACNVKSLGPTTWIQHVIRRTWDLHVFVVWKMWVITLISASFHGGCCCLSMPLEWSGIWWGLWHFLQIWGDLHFVEKWSTYQQLKHMLLVFTATILYRSVINWNALQKCKGSLVPFHTMQASFMCAVYKGRAVGFYLCGSRMLLLIVQSVSDAQAHISMNSNKAGWWDNMKIWTNDRISTDSWTYNLYVLTSLIMFVSFFLFLPGFH